MVIIGAGGNFIYNATTLLSLSIFNGDWKYRVQACNPTTSTLYDYTSQLLVWHLPYRTLIGLYKRIHFDSCYVVDRPSRSHVLPNTHLSRVGIEFVNCEQWVAYLQFENVLTRLKYTIMAHFIELHRRLTSEKVIFLCAAAAKRAKQTIFRSFSSVSRLWSCRLIQLHDVALT